MLNNIFRGIFDSDSVSVIPVEQFLLCIAVAIITGIILALVYTVKSRSSKSFVMTLALLPAVVCVVIMMVNGNVGAGVAVAGAFSLVRFRSAPGTAREIVAIFIAMGAGLITGMGYLAYAVLFTVILSAAMYVYTVTDFGMRKSDGDYKVLRITIPENLDYTGVFDDIMDDYTEKSELVSVKTSNMGSLFKLTYNVTLKDKEKEKEFIDKLRCKNGNLEISIAMQDTDGFEL